MNILNRRCNNETENNHQCRRPKTQPQPSPARSARQRENHMSRVERTAIAMLACATAACAQTSRGTVTGAITDSSGVIVAGAKVTLTGIETGARRSAAASDSGILPVRRGRSWLLRPGRDASGLPPVPRAGDWSVPVERIESRIYLFRGETVMFDADLAFCLHLQIGRAHV